MPHARRSVADTSCVGRIAVGAAGWRSAGRRSPGAWRARSSSGVERRAGAGRCSMRDDVAQLVRGTSGRCPSRRAAPRSRRRRRRTRSASSSRQRRSSLAGYSCAGVRPRSARGGLAARRRAPPAPRTAFCSAASKVRSIAITSPVAFICVPSARSASGNLSNGQRGILTTHVVERRLEGGGRLARHRVGDLVQPHADGDLGRDARDRDSRSPCEASAEERLTRGLTSMT